MSRLIEIYDMIMSDMVFLVMLPVLNILIGVGAITLNTFTAWFFRSRSRTNVMHLVYFSLSCSDFVVGVAALLQGFSLVLFSISPESLGYTGPVFYTLGQVSLHTSVLYSVMLTIVRSVNIRFKFYRLNRRAALLVIFIVPVFWLALVLSELFLSHFFLYPPNMRRLGNANHTIAVVKDMVVFPRPGGAIVFSIFCKTGLPASACSFQTVEIVVMLVNLVLPYGLPILVCLLSTVYQSYCLVLKRKSRVTQTNRRMTQTIVMLTITSLICNSAYFVVIASTRKQPFTEVLGLVQCMTSYPLLFLNSFLTPLVLCLRGSTLNKYVRGVVSLKSLLGPGKCRICKHSKPKVVKITNVGKSKLRAEKTSDECLIETII